MKRLAVIAVLVLALAGCGKSAPSTAPRTMDAEQKRAYDIAKCIGTMEHSGYDSATSSAICECLDIQVNTMDHSTEVAVPACMARYPKP